MNANELRNSDEDINYRQLLKNYMGHVRECEGITFIDKSSAHYKEYLSEGDIVVLKKLEAEI
jgi:hypothetical protein